MVRSLTNGPTTGFGGLPTSRSGPGAASRWCALVLLLHGPPEDGLIPFHQYLNPPEDAHTSLPATAHQHIHQLTSTALLTTLFNVLGMIYAMSIPAVVDTVR